MKLSKLVVHNYRSIESIEIDVDDYAALIGANGTGKSSVLYALNWLVNGGDLELTDAHSCPSHPDSAETVVSVLGVFAELSGRDRARLEKYGRGDTLTVRRSWTVGDKKSKVVGSALQGPNFASVRSASSVGDARSAYAALRTTHTDLPETSSRLPSKNDLDELLNAWEDDSSHASLLESIDDEDATNFFGFDGQNRLKQCVRVVLVPAATDIASQVAGTKRGSAVTELIGALMTNAGSAARDEWIDKHAADINELTESVKLGVETATGLQSKRINERLQNLVSGATVSFTTEVPSWIPSPAPTVATDVSIDGIANDVSKQGHGIQRAVMIAMFQSLAPDESSTEDAHKAADGETAAAAAERLMLAKSDLPTLVICIEEPEIYQHPIRARSFARVLVELSRAANVQVVIATHSPYFVRPADFESLRRFTLAEGETLVERTTLNEIATQVGGAEKLAQVEKTVNQQLPTSFAEGFFADAVVLVEGDTDKSVLEELAQKLGKPFDSAGISILEMGGKENLKVPAAMLAKLGIPTYVIADGDALGAARKHPNDQSAASGIRGSHKAATDRVVAWLPAARLAAHGSLPYQFGDSTIICDNYAIWEDDIENELAKWPSFVTAQAANNHSIRQKDMLAYRVDVGEARLEDLPDALSSLVDAIHAFRSAT